jgi:bifunctional non-homologous end joining protein LigD
MSKRVELTNLDRVLWPAAGFTKGDMVEYYRRIAPVMLPHLAGRPVVLGRFPLGVESEGFAQTECRGRPSWMQVEPVTLRDGTVRKHCVVSDVESLVWAANQCAIELHVLPWRAGADRRADAVLFDLDPGPACAPARTLGVARRLRDRLAELGLRCCAKLSGSAGIHVHVPLNGAGADRESAVAFARGLARTMAEDDPSGISATLRREGRAAKVLIDWVGNSDGRSMIAPFSLRATDMPSVAAPVGWSEIEAAAATGGPLPAVHPSLALGRVGRRGDDLLPVLQIVQRLPGQSVARR